VPYVLLAEKAIRELVEKIVREIAAIVKEAGTAFIDDTNSDLAAAKPGDTILTLLVVSHAGGRIELQYRQFLKYGFAKIRFAIDDQLNHGPEYIQNVELLAVLGDVRISGNSYEVILGYGFDKGPPAFEAARGKIALKTPPLSIDAFLAGSPEGGFVLDFGIGTNNSGSSGFPLIIPLGPSGFALQGIGGTFADNFRPNLAPTTGASEPEHPTAFDYIKWAQEQAMKPLDGWRPLKAGEGHVGGVGLRTDIIDLFSNGGLIRIRDAGFLALSDGPLAITGGRGQLLSLPPANFRFDLISALDFNSLTYAAMGAVALSLPGDKDSFEIISAEGAITAQISLKNARDWFFNVGTDNAPIKGSFLKDVFTASVFCMTSFDRIYVGSRVSFGGKDFNFFGLKIDAYFGMETRAKLGFQPIHFEGHLILFGGLGIQIWKFKLGIELSGAVYLAILKPFKLELSVGWQISLPWPLPDISGTVRLLSIDQPTLPEIAKPILLKAATRLSGDFGGLTDSPIQKLGALHTLSGLQFDIENETSKIWPDSELALPFYKKLADRTGKLLSAPVGTYNEGAVKVNHRLDVLTLYRVNETDGSEVEVPNLQGVWVVGPAAKQGSLNTPTARLHFPANDPFRWLDQFQNTEIVTTEMPPVGQEFDFGVGPAELGNPEVLLATIIIARAGPVGIDLISDPSFALPTRVARMSRATFSMLEIDGTAVGTLSRAVLTFVSFEKAEFSRFNSDRQLRLLSVTEQKRQSDTVYFARIEVTDSGRMDFDNFTISYNGANGCVEGVKPANDRCDATTSLYRVTLFGAATRSVTVKERVILQPGLYRIAVQGSSDWRVQGAPKVGSWQYTQKFRIVPPPTITPYIAYVTLGDERPYNLKGKNIWNPTPHGLGFPGYTALKGSVVFRPDYFSKIFKNVNVAFSSPAGTSQVVPVKVSGVDERFESASSARWQRDAGGLYGFAEELLFDALDEPGVAEIQISYDDTVSGKNVKLDAWTFETSRYADVVAHLQLAEPNVTVARSSISQTEAGPEAKAIAALDESAVTGIPADVLTIPTQWRLPPAFKPQHLNFEEQAPLSLLRFVERSAIPISRTNSDPLFGVMQRPRQTVIEAFTDRDGKGFCFWVRTPEPLDWRRLSLRALVYTLVENPAGTASLPDLPPLPLELVFTPSPDGASALMFARSGETFVRLPKGLYVIEGKFALKAPGLSHLRMRVDNTQEFQDVKIRLANTFGASFPR
jgi:hypothetical protein